MLPGSWVESNRVEALVGFEILGELRVLSMDEEHVVSRQPPRPQVLGEVDRVLFVVVCSFYLQKKIIFQCRKHHIQLQG